MKNILFAIMALLFVFQTSTVRAEEVNHAPTLVGFGAATVYVTGSNPAGWVALATMYMLGNSKYEHSCNAQPFVKRDYGTYTAMVSACEGS